MLEPPVERVRISQAGKDQLLKLRRVTGINQWNILCRWAFCRSLAEPTPPSPVPIPADSNVEMTWQIFGGAIADQLSVSLKQRCHQDKIEITAETLAVQFRAHLHRGIGYLSSDVKVSSIDSLIKKPFES